MMRSPHARTCARTQRALQTRSWDEAHVAAFCVVSLFRPELQTNIFGPKRSRKAAPTRPKIVAFGLFWKRRERGEGGFGDPKRERLSGFVRFLLRL